MVTILQNNRWVPVFLILCLIISSLNAEPIVRLKSNFIDLGKIEKKDTKIIYKFPILNEGTEPLLIEYVGSSCGCTTANNIDSMINAGESGQISIEVDPSKANPGYSKQRLLFKTNDPKNKILPVDVYYRCGTEEVAVAPEKIEIELSKKEVLSTTGRSKNTVTIIDSWINNLKITDIQTSPNLLTSFYDIRYRCKKGSEIHVLRFETELSPNLSVGKFSEWLKFSTNHPRYPTITIPIMGKVLSNVGVSPNILIFRESQLSKSIKCTINESFEELEIDSVLTEDKWITTRTRKISPRQILIDVSIDSNMLKNLKDGLLKSKVHIFFEKPDKEELSVEILYLR